MKSLFRCPLCASPLEREENCWSCPAGHSFDRASSGYVHLLPANQKHSKDPGDDKAMVAARSTFLDKGYYAPLREALCCSVAEYAVNFPTPVLIDSGCGEGYPGKIRAGEHSRNQYGPADFRRVCHLRPCHEKLPQSQCGWQHPALYGHGGSSPQAELWIRRAGVYPEGSGTVRHHYFHRLQSCGSTPDFVGKS